MTTKNLGILLYDMVQPMDVIGPWEVFAIWKTILNAPINMYLVSESGNSVKCDSQVVLNSHSSFTNAPKFDYFIIPGGRGRREQSQNKKLIDFIKKQQSCEYLLSVCTGMFLLYHAGLLTNKIVTTYWRAIPELQRFNDVNLCGKRIVKSNNIWTAGGVSSGIDLALELIAEIESKEAAGEVQLLFEYFPEQLNYTNEQTKNRLPNYSPNISTIETQLPDYILNYIKSSPKQGT